MPKHSFLLPDEPRYLGDEDVFVLQDKVIDHLLAADREVEARAAALGQAMGRALHTKLKTANENWKASKDDATLVNEVASLSEQFGKQRSDEGTIKRLNREDLALICFEYVSG